MNSLRYSSLYVVMNNLDSLISEREKKNPLFELLLFSLNDLSISCVFCLGVIVIPGLPYQGANSFLSKGA